jgi:uncharacterized protein YegJ (DUF2314 family)
MSRALLAAVAGFVLHVGADYAMGTDDIVGVRSDDPQMIAAINMARGSLPKFFDALARPNAKQKSFVLKVAFRRGDDVEHIWVADLDFSGKRPRGVIADKPQMKGLRFMQKVFFDPADITDWMYIEDGKLVGGYTTRLLRERMSSEQRRQLDASVPYQF